MDHVHTASFPGLTLSEVGNVAKIVHVNDLWSSCIFVVSVEMVSQGVVVSYSRSFSLKLRCAALRFACGPRPSTEILLVRS